jgi:hypothetical protein
VDPSAARLLGMVGAEGRLGNPQELRARGAGSKGAELERMALVRGGNASTEE